MASSPCLRGRIISSPLEAGPSVAEGHHLPGHVNDALEYASQRLGRKAAHITLLVVRRDYQLLTSPIASPTFTPGSPPVSAASTPSRTAFPTTSRIEALKQLVRLNNAGEGQTRERIVHVHLDQARNGTASPAFSEASTFSASTVSSVSTANSTFSHRLRWPGSPTAYGSVPLTPATPYTVASSVSGTHGTNAVSQLGPQPSTQFGIKLVYAHPLSPRDEKALSQALEKAAKKFKLGPSWLPQAVSHSTLGLPVDLVLKSTAQHESLFSSEHLTLLSLDHLYTFRTALQAYARTKASCRLEDAVDELRRLFLANGRRAVRKSALLAAYRWLDPVNDAALADVCRMYERAYGGIEKESGVENDVDPVPAWPLAEGNRNFGDMEQSLARRKGVSLQGSRGADYSPHPEEKEEDSQSKTPILDLTDALEKEVLLATADLSLEDHLELDEVEKWYREIQSQNNVPAGEIHPLRSHPSSATAVDVIPPEPSSPPPPPPTTATWKDRPWSHPEELSLEEMRRTTPKLRPAPPRRAVALKLQTTFNKPTVGSNKTHSIPKQQRPETETAGLEIQEEEEEQLTARPHSAIKSFASVRWSATMNKNNNNNNGISIDEIVNGGGRYSRHSDSDEKHTGERHLQPQQRDERIGPMTPNGYDDISPITRGEWGLLMFGKGKTARVETC
ncbi:hypothetical protein N657DRAFT_573141 [Parathielavia appendiculata]|uniref:DUF7582 domain-containing protein n=1 Tax=Parathielavia appendiculata TaxID=2587402 RepID=A0AAN6TZU4_9PEZI|nr:hypothetical protein N657DRAFT_573141 [Parathielavia appendiculata]